MVLRVSTSPSSIWFHWERIGVLVFNDVEFTTDFTLLGFLAW
jgi:hypothetical protein